MVAGSVADPTAIEDAISQSQGKVAGVIQLATLLKARKCCSDQKPGQANNFVADSFLDAFVYYRRGLKLPAPLVSLGLCPRVGHCVICWKEMKDTEA